MGHRSTDDMDHFYYDPASGGKPIEKGRELLNRVPFCDSGENQANQ